MQNNRNSLVSVIVPAYNAEKFIEETIQSVLSQTYLNLEVLVVNDGSPDNLGNIVEELQKNDTRLQYYYQQNRGVSVARNFGFSKSSGDYIAFLDADDIWLPNNIEQKIRVLEASKEIGLVHSDAVIIDEKSTPTNKYLQGKEGYLLDTLLAWEGTCIPSPSSILAKREVIDTIGGFDKDLSTAADQEFFFRVASKYKIGRVSEVTWQYRVHDNNMHSNIALMERDELLAYKKAAKLGLFKSFAFRLKCYSNMYMILGGSWWVNGNNKIKGTYYICKSLLYYFPNISKLRNKII